MPPLLIIIGVAALLTAAEVGIQALLGGSAEHGPRELNRGFSTSTYGADIWRCRGTVRLPGNLVWSTIIQETVYDRQTSKKSDLYTYWYSCSLAIGFAQGPATAWLTLWTDGKRLYSAKVHNATISGVVTLLASPAEPALQSDLVINVRTEGNSTLSLEAGAVLNWPGDDTDYEVLQSLTLGPNQYGQIQIWPPLFTSKTQNAAMLLPGATKDWLDNTDFQVPSEAGEYSSSGPRFRMIQQPTFYLGTAGQLPDPVLQEYLGADNVPGYRNLVYCVLDQLQLANFGNHIPSFTAEIAFDGTTGQRAFVGPVQDATATQLAIPYEVPAGQSPTGVVTPWVVAVDNEQTLQKTPIQIINRTPFSTATDNSNLTVILPAVGAGNTLIVCSGSPWYQCVPAMNGVLASSNPIATAPVAGASMGFIGLSVSSPFDNTAGCNISWFTNVPGGATTISWASGRAPNVGVIYELSPCYVADWNDNALVAGTTDSGRLTAQQQQEGSPVAASDQTNLYISCVTAEDDPSGSYALSSPPPWKLDYEASASNNGAFFGAPEFPSMAIAIIPDGTGTQQATWTYTGTAIGGGYWSECAIALSSGASATSGAEELVPAPQVVRRTAFARSDWLGELVTMTIPATTAGNTLVVVQVDEGGAFAPIPVLGRWQLPTKGFGTVQVGILAFENVAGGETTISYPFASEVGMPANVADVADNVNLPGHPSDIVVYELTPCVVDSGAFTAGSTFRATTWPPIGPPLTGSGNDLFISSLFAFTTSGGFSGANSPWTFDYSVPKTRSGAIDPLADPTDFYETFAVAVTTALPGSVPQLQLAVNPDSGIFVNHDVGTADFGTVTYNEWSGAGMTLKNSKGAQVTVINGQSLAVQNKFSLVDTTTYPVAVDTDGFLYAFTARGDGLDFSVKLAKYDILAGVKVDEIDIGQLFKDASGMPTPSRATPTAVTLFNFYDPAHASLRKCIGIVGTGGGTLVIDRAASWSSPWTTFFDWTPTS